jgi:DNA-binding cell septation regulator SpoVG
MSTIEKCDVISVRKVQGFPRLRGFLDIRIGGSLIIRGCTVYDGKNGRFAQFPRKVSSDGKWSNVVIAADDQIKEQYQKEMLKAFEEA